MASIRVIREVLTRKQTGRPTLVHYCVRRGRKGKGQYVRCFKRKSHAKALAKRLRGA